MHCDLCVNFYHTFHHSVCVFFPLLFLISPKCGNFLCKNKHKHTRTQYIHTIGYVPYILTHSHPYTINTYFALFSAQFPSIGSRKAFFSHSCFVSGCFFLSLSVACRWIVVYVAICLPMYAGMCEFEEQKLFGACSDGT